ncbi:tetratricopeptide repeat protein [Azospirillum sp. sgz302134]
MKRILPVLATLAVWPGVINAQTSPDVQTTERATSDLSYESYIESDKRFKCLYGYAASKTGDHVAAARIFEDCIRRWNDVYSMIWLADLYESGLGVPKDSQYATDLMRRGAELHDEAGYSTLARFHYGVALYEGHGVDKDSAAGLRWLRQAASENLKEAQEYLDRIGAPSR